MKRDGKTQIVITGGDCVTGHDPDTGREIWRANGLNPGRRGNYRIVASPVVIGDMIYAPTRQRPLLALAAGGTGDVSDNVVWKWEGAAAPDVPTPTSDGKYFYMVDDRGRRCVWTQRPGAEVWGPERTTQGIVSASPHLADGKLFLLNEYAVTTVLAAGPKFEVWGRMNWMARTRCRSPVSSGSQLLFGRRRICIVLGMVRSRRSQFKKRTPQHRCAGAFFASGISNVNYSQTELENFMTAALVEGRKALPECLPNPPVGCVLVREGKIIARGHTNPPGSISRRGNGSRASVRVHWKMSRHLSLWSRALFTGARLLVLRHLLKEKSEMSLSHSLTRIPKIVGAAFKFSKTRIFPCRSVC